MKVQLLVNGKQIIFTDVENISISEDLSDAKDVTITEVAQKPTEGKWFRVNPMEIDQEFFKKCRLKDIRQKETRIIILRAFEEVNGNPQKYGRPFFTMIPKKTWESKTVAELMKYAKEKGDHIADWVEQAMEWAQRIHNGESWETLCNKPDTAKWYRLVVSKHPFFAKAVGHSSESNSHFSASEMSDLLGLERIISETVPLVVAY